MENNEFYNENFDKKIPKKMVFDLEGKVFYSVQEMRENATDEQLMQLKLAFNDLVLKTEKEYKLANLKFALSAGLSILSVAMFIGSFFLPTLPDAILKSTAVFGFISGNWLVKENVRKYAPLEDYLNQLCDIEFEIEEELIQRECRKFEEEKERREEKEIFSDIFGEYEEKEVG